jgi:hypothetical protein
MLEEGMRSKKIALALIDANTDFIPENGRGAGVRSKEIKSE